MTNQKSKIFVSIIAAIGPKRELGKDNKLLWHISEDLKRFKKLTEGHAVIMGRKTFESLGKPLPNRLNIIITRRPQSAPACHRYAQALAGRSRRVISLVTPIKFGHVRGNLIIASSLQEALNFVKSKKFLTTNYRLLTTKNEVFIIGGGQIYAQALPLADKLYLTIVEKTPEHADGKFTADTYFPQYEKLFEKVVFEEKKEMNGYRYRFLEIER